MVSEHRPLRVALDATPLSMQSGGIRRYVVELVAALAGQFPKDEYHLLTDQPAPTRPEEWAGFPNVISEGPRSNPLRAKWWSVGLPLELARRDIDVFHGTDFAIPYLPRRPAVLTLHDLAPWKPAPVRPPGSDRVRQRTPALLRIATRIITPSDAVRREVAEFFAIPTSKIRATPLAAAAAPASSAGDDSSAKLWRRLEIEEPYLLYVGSAEPRKNLPRLMEAWRQTRLEIPGLSLVLVGSGHGVSAEATVEPGLHLAGHLKDKEITQLLSSAAAFVYPSLYEGFGLPVLEAMQAGAPVITSNDPALTEVTAGAAVYVDAASQAQLSAAVLGVVRDHDLQRRLREDGRRRARRFSWRSTASLTRAVYADAIRSF